MIHLIIRRYKRIKPFLDKIKHDNIFAIAGQSAFFLILSSVPLSMFARYSRSFKYSSLSN